MFNLIITIISIALIVVMAVASVYYGGEAFTQGTAKGNASALLQQSQQINAAVVLANNDGATFTTVESLGTGNNDYLSAAPVPPAKVASTGWSFAASGDTTVTLTAQDVCEAVNESAGLDLDAGTAGMQYMNAAAPTDVAAANALVTTAYGCVMTAADTYSYFYKN